MADCGGILRQPRPQAWVVPAVEVVAACLAEEVDRRDLAIAAEDHLDLVVVSAVASWLVDGQLELSSVQYIAEH